MVCASCKNQKTVDQMVRNRSTRTGFSPYCKECNRVKFKKWRVENTEKARQLSRISGKAWRDANPERARRKAMDSYYRHHDERREAQVWARLWSRYGITEENYNDLMAEQGNVCAICKQECKTGERLSVDHDHDTGRVRGLLCRACNFRVGQIEKPGLELFQAYLNKQ